MISSAFLAWKRRHAPFAVMMALVYANTEGLDSLAGNESIKPPGVETNSTLRTAQQVHLLTRQEATRRHRAVIRGVVTCSLPGSAAVVIQDATRGLYVDQIISGKAEPPRIGELIEIEGVTDP